MRPTPAETQHTDASERSQPDRLKGRRPAWRLWQRAAVFPGHRPPWPPHPMATQRQCGTAHLLVGTPRGRGPQFGCAAERSCEGVSLVRGPEPELELKRRLRGAESGGERRGEGAGGTGSATGQKGRLPRPDAPGPRQAGVWRLLCSLGGPRPGPPEPRGRPGPTVSAGPSRPALSGGHPEFCRRGARGARPWRSCRTGADERRGRPRGRGRRWRAPRPAEAQRRGRACWRRPARRQRGGVACAPDGAAGLAFDEVAAAGSRACGTRGARKQTAGRGPVGA